MFPGSRRKESSSKDFVSQAFALDVEKKNILTLKFDV